MNELRPAANYRQHLLFLALATSAAYSLYYFVLLGMPIAGVPTFRIDYFVTTVIRADKGLFQTLLHARPVAEFYLYLQELVSKQFLDSQARFIIYPIQHLSLIVYFLSTYFCIQSLLR